MALREFAAQELWRIMGFDEVDEIMLTIDEIMLTIGGGLLPQDPRGVLLLKVCTHVYISQCLLVGDTHF
jgi:hypothetical protein